MQAMRTPNGIIYNATVLPAICLDLDGTVRRSKHGGFIEVEDDIELIPGVAAQVLAWKQKGFLIYGCSNQGGVAHGFKNHNDCCREHVRTVELFVSDCGENPFNDIFQAYHDAKGNVEPFNHRSLCRKPDIGMLVLAEIGAWDEGYIIDWDNSIFVGDRPEDEECAKRAGIQFQWAWDFFGFAKEVKG